MTTTHRTRTDDIAEWEEIDQLGVVFRNARGMHRITQQLERHDIRTGRSNRRFARND